MAKSAKQTDFIKCKYTGIPDIHFEDAGKEYHISKDGIYDLPESEYVVGLLASGLLIKL